MGHSLPSSVDGVCWDSLSNWRGDELIPQRRCEDDDEAKGGRTTQCLMKEFDNLDDEREETEDVTYLRCDIGVGAEIMDAIPTMVGRIDATARIALDGDNDAARMASTARVAEVAIR